MKQAEPDQFYDQEYFSWQESTSINSAPIASRKFEKEIRSDDIVLDFGCGGGFVLDRINCKKKVGVEINEHARSAAADKLDEVYADLKQVPDNSVDVVISHHALEHVISPYHALIEMHRCLKKEGKLVLVVPHEIRIPFRPNDRNQHLFTWSEMCLGNLVTAASFKVQSAKTLHSKLPPRHRWISKYFGGWVIRILSKVWGFVDFRIKQVKVVAFKD